MAPGFYDAVLATCRDAAFEPSLDEHAGGSTVWRNIAQGRGVAFVVGSLIEQLPRGIKLVELGEPAPALIIDLVWHRETAGAAVEHVLNTAREVGRERRWLRAGHK
jgi:DNA-binding transcriptional LysR family regulator